MIGETALTDILHGEEYFTITQSCSILSTIFSAKGLAYSLNCSSEQSAATPCAGTSSRALGQNDFTRPKAWLTYVVGASAMKLRTFCGAPRSRSSRDHLSAPPSSCGSTTSTSYWAATLRPSNSFWRCSFSSPSVLIC
jgi:hypothetical protein